MKMKYLFAILFLVSIFLPLSSQNMSSEYILNKSIVYHDPDGILMYKDIALGLNETRPNGDDRKSDLLFNISKSSYEFKKIADGVEVKTTINSDGLIFSVDGKPDLSQETLDKYRLSEKRARMMKNYYEYLWLVPLKLKDPGTIINPKAKKGNFFDKQSLEIKVTYDPQVGHDIWYFYFHPETYALQGYRFYHDESKNDGEYIILDGETRYKSVRLPKTRKWYTHKEDKFLGSDILESISF